MIDRQQALAEANPASVISRADGRIVELKAHRALWSGRHRENSLAGLRECYAARLARVEIDFLWHGSDFVVVHDRPRRGARAPRLRDALEVVRAAPPGPTLLMLDAKDDEPWPWPRVEALARLCEEVRDRIFVGSPADWNLRRLRSVDPAVVVAFDPQYYLDLGRRVRGAPGRIGAYGYQDAHPLALRRTIASADYLRERFETLLGLVAGIREIHVRLDLFERMWRDGFDPAAAAHAAGVAIDVWTLDAGTRRWRDRLARAIAAGADVVTTNTPRELAEAGTGSARA